MESSEWIDMSMKKSRQRDQSLLDLNNTSKKKQKTTIARKSSIPSKRKTYEKQKDTPKILYCKFCRKEFTTVKDVVLHQDTVHKDVKPYPCEHCGIAFHKKKEMVAHVVCILFEDWLTFQ